MASPSSRSFTAASRPPLHAKPISTTQTHGVALLPIAALMLAASLNASAQTSPSPPPNQPSADAPAKTGEKSLKAVTVKEKAEVVEGRDAVRATTTTVGKGNQPLRDIPQSVTVVTEKLINDRNLDTVKDVLRNTAGVTFMLNEDGMVLCNPRDQEAAHRAEVEGIATLDRDAVTCRKCLDLIRHSARNGTA